MVHSSSIEYDKLLRFLELDGKLEKASDGYEKISVLADAFISKIFFDTVKNIEVKKPLLEIDELVSGFVKGRGANCIEQSFLLKSLLEYLNIKSNIYHADVYDYDQGAVKSAFISIVFIPLDRGFIHIDTVRGFYFWVNDKKITSNSSLEFTLSYIENGYVVTKYRDGAVYWKEEVLFQLPESYRKERLLGFIEEDGNVSPYGVLAPLYSMSNPWRAIFYDLPSLKLKVVDGESVKFIDIVELDDVEPVSWLTMEMKERIYSSINHINEYIMEHHELINRSKSLFSKLN